MESDEELVIIALLLEEEEERRGNKRKHKIWIHGIFKKISQFGEYTLFTDLLNDDVKFFQYFRMSRAKFKTLLDNLSPHILRQNTTYGEAIDPE